MNEKTKYTLKAITVLMVTSQLLLLAFVCYWLRSEYKNEEDELKKALTAELVFAKKRVADSILTERFITPMMKDTDSTLKSIKIKSVINHTNNTPKTRIAIYTTDSLMKSNELIAKRKDLISKRMDSIDKATVFISTDQESIIEIDSEKSYPVLSTIFKALATEIIKDSLFQTDFFKELSDSSKTRLEFEQTLDDKGWHFKARWDSADTVNLNNKALLIRLDDEEKQMSVSGYKLHLLKKITPQILFTILLTLTSGLAFWLIYHSLRKQIRLSEMKNGLISNMSHELKTPVSTVKVALEALDSFDVVNQPDKAREYIQMAMLETHRLELLVNKALNTSLMEQGKMTIQRQPHDLSKILQEIVDALKLRLEQNNTTMNLRFSGTDFKAKVDKLHVQGAVMNIIDNSIKYVKQPVTIDINVIASDASITIELKDNGEGIPEQYIEQVFEKFFRVPDGDKHDVKGYGLGLSYVQQVMQQHKGLAQVINAKNGGCIFKLQFFRGR